jgi:hypothetical protein
LRGAVEQVIDDYISTGSKKVTISGMNRDDILQINIVAESPESGTAISFLGARLAEKIAAFHQGSFSQLQSPDGSAALALKLPIIQESI